MTITLLFALYLILLLVFRPDRTRVYCGMAGFSPKAGLTYEGFKKAFINMKILGIYNQSRGVHGCGIYINGKITKGVDKEKLWKDFLSNNALEIVPKRSNALPIIVHCRQATIGSHTPENTHPLSIENKILAHNGTISNIQELQKKYGEKSPTGTVDSFILGNLLLSQGYHILEEYIGYAALIFTYQNSDKLYVYRGESKQYKDGKLEEERPLYYLKTKEGIYFSSMQNSLEAISFDKSDVLDIVPANEVWQVKDGDFHKKVFTVNRSEMNIKAPKKTSFYNYNKASNYNSQYAYNDIWRDTYPTSYSDSSYTSYKNTALLIPNKTLVKLELETEPGWKKEKSMIYDDFIYFHKNRYFRQEKNKAPKLMEGKVHINGNGAIFEYSTFGTAAFYFKKGIMISPKAYKKIENNLVNTKSINSYLFINSVVPVTDLGKMGTTDKFYYKGALCKDKDSFTPPFSDRRYVFNNYGELSGIELGTYDKKHSIDIQESKDKSKDASSIYDQIFAYSTDFYANVTKEEIQIILYVIELNEIPPGTFIKPNELENSLASHISEIVKSKKTLREHFDDYTYSLSFVLDEHYSETEEIPQEEEIYQEIKDSLETLFDHACELTEVNTEKSNLVAQELFRAITKIEEVLK